MRFTFLLLLILGLEPLSLPGQNGALPERQTRAETPGLSHTPANTYDPARNAVADIDGAIAEARKAGKRVILDIGGDWCPWCRTLDSFFQEHPDLLKLRDQNFITVPVYYGSGNKNKQALSLYSKVLGIPHFFVLDANGALLHSQHMVDLQTGGNYSPDKMKGFLIKWSPVTVNTSQAGSNLRSKSQRQYP
jgi:thiol:disulfide interchange protein